MNEELTRVFEKYELEAMIEYYKNNNCSRRVARELATALLEERAKPKDDVWTFAPDIATTAAVEWRTKKGKAIGSCIYTREMPETRADELADEAAKLLPFACVNGNCNYVRDTIKIALNKYAEELKGEA